MKRWQESAVLVMASALCAGAAALVALAVARDRTPPAKQPNDAARDELPWPPSQPPLLLLVSNDSACAARLHGRLQCWGVLKPSCSGIDCREVSPTFMEGIDGVRQLLGSGRHGCALLDDDSIHCWGTDFRFRSKHGAFAIADPKRPISELGPAKAIAGTLGNLCALDRHGDVWCEGRDDEAPRLVVRRATMLSTGDTTHVCASVDAGAVACWGENERGELGSGDTKPHRDAVVVPGVSNVRALAVHQSHSAALLEDGSVVCWGDCGSRLALAPVPVPNMKGTTDLGTGANFDNCIVTADGHVRCACMGALDAHFSTYFSRHVSGGKGWCNFAFDVVHAVDHLTVVAHWGQRACAARADDSVWCWKITPYGSGYEKLSLLPF